MSNDEIPVSPELEKLTEVLMQHHAMAAGVISAAEAIRQDLLCKGWSGPGAEQVSVAWLIRHLVGE